MVDENKEDHAPDLEWMLRSQQVDDEFIIDLLLDEYYVEIFQIALAKLTYPKLAFQATRETFIRAVLTAEANPPEEGIRDWLVAIAAEEISQKQKYLAEQRLRNSRLFRALIGTKTHTTNNAESLVFAKKEIKVQLRSRQAAVGKRSRYKEITLAGISIIAFLLILKLAALAIPSTDIQASQSGENLSQFQEFLERERISFEASPYYPQSLISNLPLTIESSHTDIWRRILMSKLTWTSIWADISVILHGPADYIGPPLVERHQIWMSLLSQDQEGIHISGSLDGGNLLKESITLYNDGPGTLNLMHGYDDYSRLGSQIPWFYLSSNSIASVPYMANFFFIADYDFPPDRLNYQAIEESVWADHPVVVVNVTDNLGVLQATLWLDALTGLALREQFYAGDGTSQVRLETSVNRVAYNQQFPDGLLEKLSSEEEQAVFAADFTGKPENPEAIPELSIWQALSSRAAPPAMYPPEDFDPGNSHLSFVWSSPGSDQLPVNNFVQLYANQYLLGDLFTDDPWHSICARSMDGSEIVISQWSQSPEKLESQVGWYDLKNFQSNLIRIPNAAISRLSFSPDKKHIAAAGIDQKSGNIQLYLIDTQSGQWEQIPGFLNAWSLAWSPDGTQIAGLNLPSFRVYSPWKVRILVYEIESKEISSTTIQDNFSWGNSSAHIPLNGWTAEFPLTMHGLEPCILPPQTNDY